MVPEAERRLDHAAFYIRAVPCDGANGLIRNADSPLDLDVIDVEFKVDMLEIAHSEEDLATVMN